MPTDYEFCKSPEELYNNVIEFHSAKELQRAALGNNPLYFVHVALEEESAFSLSKFTAMRNVNLEAYILGERKKTDGGKTQKHISRLLKEKWEPYNEVSEMLKQNFSAWIHSLIPKYNVHRAYFLTISPFLRSSKLPFKKSSISPERLRDQLKLQVIMGELGESIAFQYECDRLSKLGADPEKCVDYVALYNTSAGFDILSKYQQNRSFIEVKASFTKDASFYLTSNEYETLERFGEESYLYRVLIEDLDNRKGKVVDVIQNPINIIKNKGSFTPILYRISGI